MEKTVRERVLDYVFIFIGCALMAFAITSILKPNNLVTGGITGISIIADRIIHVKYTYIYYVLSLGVLVSAFIFLGKKDGKRIIVLSLLYPIILMVFEEFNVMFIENDLILASIYYGVISGVGCGLVLKRGFSLGGTDTIAKIFHRRILPFVSMSQILLVIDTMVIAISAIVYDMNIALYAIVTQFIFVKAMDAVLFGLKSKKIKLEIVSKEYEEIIEYILNTMRRGVSTYDIKGAYTDESRVKIICICSPRDVILIKNFIAKVDPHAFLYGVSVNSVWGEGADFESLVEENI
ncbi:YitT family protein [Anaeromicrobium sediminis]|uniref:Membrane protein n=1 Tax=Anaeromicrobium sediminis TaxID=1478221 RepID=A0A267MKU1_9FIRM|nr:YitT family protein [Anaeromicrobium sediminis]PAB59538.1 membrane protein [Anaeromicrobium sediminis]